MPHHVAYMLHFSERENARLDAPYPLEHYRKPWAITAGIGATILVSISQGILYAQPHLYHYIATYGCLPVGVVIGIATYRLIARHVDQQFRQRWDPLYLPTVRQVAGDRRTPA